MSSVFDTSYGTDRRKQAITPHWGRSTNSRGHGRGACIGDTYDLVLQWLVALVIVRVIWTILRVRRIDKILSNVVFYKGHIIDLTYTH